MKKIYVNEDWCINCHLCELYCSAASSHSVDLLTAFKKGSPASSKIFVETSPFVNLPVSCRQCNEPLCLSACITNAITKNKNGIVCIDNTRCTGCYLCVASCPYGCIFPEKSSSGGFVTKCELCNLQFDDVPPCVKACPNNAIVYEERG